MIEVTASKLRRRPHPVELKSKRSKPGGLFGEAKCRIDFTVISNTTETLSVIDGLMARIADIGFICHYKRRPAPHRIIHRLPLGIDGDAFFDTIRAHHNMTSKCKTPLQVIRAPRIAAFPDPPNKLRALQNALKDHEIIKNMETTNTLLMGQRHLQMRARS